MGSILWDHGKDRRDFEKRVAARNEVIESFNRWWNHGRKRNVGHENFIYDLCMDRFIEGWRDSENHASDFKRRGMSHDTGERSAYMSARFLSSASRVGRKENA